MREGTIIPLCGLVIQVRNSIKRFGAWCCPHICSMLTAKTETTGLGLPKEFIQSLTLVIFQVHVWWQEYKLEQSIIAEKNREFRRAISQIPKEGWLWQLFLFWEDIISGL